MGDFEKGTACGRLGRGRLGGQPRRPWQARVRTCVRTHSASAGCAPQRWDAEAGAALGFSLADGLPLLNSDTKPPHRCPPICVPISIPLQSSFSIAPKTRLSSQLCLSADLIIIILGGLGLIPSLASQASPWRSQGDQDVRGPRCRGTSGEISHEGV
jgi:hypothetical protein